MVQGIASVSAFGFDAAGSATRCHIHNTHRAPYSTSHAHKLGSADMSRTTPLSDPNHQRPFASTGLRQVLRAAWAMTHPYWFSEDRWAAWGLLLAVIALNLGIVYINVLLNKWNNTFYDALQDKNYTVFFHQLIRFSWLAGLYMVFAVYQFYLKQMLQS